MYSIIFYLKMYENPEFLESCNRTLFFNDLHLFFDEHLVSRTMRGLTILLFLLSHEVVSDSLWPHELQHSSLPHPSSFTIYQGLLNLISIESVCHPTISPSVTPFSCPQSFPASRSFPMSWLFASSGQRFGTSASALVFPMST